MTKILIYNWTNFRRKCRIKKAVEVKKGKVEIIKPVSKHFSMFEQYRSETVPGCIWRAAMCRVPGHATAIPPSRHPAARQSERRELWSGCESYHNLDTHAYHCSDMSRISLLPRQIVIRPYVER